MKKKILCSMLAAVMVCCILPMTASADTNGSEGQIDVTYELKQNDIEPPSGGSGNSSADDDDSSTPAGTYLVTIPSSVALNYEEDFLINSQNVDIGEDRRLVVSIDGAKTYPDGPFYLYCDDSKDDATKRIECNILRGSSADFSIPPSEQLTGPGDAVVATFSSGGNGAPDTYGWVKLCPAYDTNNAVGTYRGTIYFKIGIENK